MTISYLCQLVFDGRIYNYFALKREAIIYFFSHRNFQFTNFLQCLQSNYQIIS